MDNNRLQKVARLIQKDMGEILRYESKNLFKGAMITVTKVRVSSDLSIAKIYISIFALSGVTTDEVFELVKANKPLLRNKLASMERNQLRIIPDLSFFVDDSLDYSENIDRLLLVDLEIYNDTIGMTPERYRVYAEIDGNIIHAKEY